jgi:hypothetical protein
MYRQGLGDCFLLTLKSDADRPFRMLIDCGLLLGTPDAEITMNRIARDIALECESYLDVVVATHPHWEHVSGFLQAQRVFDDIKMGEVWLPWTEDPADALAENLRSRQQRTLQGLRVAASRITRVDADAGARLRRILNAFGAASHADAHDAIAYLIGHRSKPRIRYLRPGDLPLPLTHTARAFVLGPPTLEGAQALQPGGASKSGMGLAPTDPVATLLAALGGLSDAESRLPEQVQAFSPRYRLPTEGALGHKFFREHYLQEADSWRRIDSEWLGTAEQFTLALDNDANNASLAMAIELEPVGRVLLFPADSQESQWQSWLKLRWDIEVPARCSVLGIDLLKRTVLYKVGHHGSSSATPESGLQMMTSSDLVALLPTCQAAAQRLGWPQIPFPALLGRLISKTRGRILQSDIDWPEQPDKVSDAEWESFIQRIRADENGLYFEISIS